jgi:hypothetical protein
VATRRSTNARQLFGAGEGWSGVESPEASASARRIVLCGDGVALMNSCRARLRLGAMQEQQCREASAFDLGAIRSGSLWGQRFRPRFLRVARGAMGGDWRICAVCWFFGASGARLRLGWCGEANHQRLRSQPIRVSSERVSAFCRVALRVTMTGPTSVVSEGNVWCWDLRIKAQREANRDATREGLRTRSCSTDRGRGTGFRVGESIRS